LSNNYQSRGSKIPQSYQWIEALLQTPIPDHRKSTIDLVLCPYLLNIKHLSFDQTFSKVTDWTLKCNAFRVLQPSVNNFLDYRMKLAIDRSVKNRIPPIKRETMKENYSDWYRDFEKWHIFD